MHTTRGNTRTNYHGWPDPSEKKSVAETPQVETVQNTQERTMLNDKQKVVLLRFLRTIGAAVVAAFLAWLAGPDALELIPDHYEILVIAVITPVLTAIEKSLRYGDGPGENPDAKLLTLNK